MQRIFLLVFLLFIISSCEDTIQPEGTYREKFILTGILKPHTSDQELNLALSHPGITSDYLENNPIKNAEVNVWFDEEIRIFESAETEVSDTLFENGIIDNYINDEFEVEPGQTYEIGVLLNDGRRLAATTTIPNELELSIVPDSRKLDPSAGDQIILNWEEDENSNYKVIRSYIVYDKPVNGEIKTFKIEVPEKYIEVGGEKIPSYPKPDRVGNFSLDPEIIDQEIRKIGEGVSKKYEITIKYIYVEIFIYDEHLTKYYESTRDDISNGIITVDQIGYSNIEGGEGIFASYYTQKTSFFFDFEYIFTLGYTPEDVIE